LNILILKFGALGDVIRTSYILPGLHRKYDDPKIFWMTAQGSFDLLRFNPYISGIITPDFRMDLLRTPFDLVVSMDDEKKVLGYIGALQYNELTGSYLSDGVPVYTDKAAEWFDMGLISRFGKTRADELKKLNTREHSEILADMLDIEIQGPAFFNSPVIEERAAARFDRGYFNIGLNSGAGSRWLSKQLEMNEALTLIEELLRISIGGKQTRVYLLGGGEEARRHALIRDALASDRLIDAGNDNSLLEFAAIIKCCDYVITSDSLALHLAISQKVKNLSFFSPTSAAEIGTFGTGVKVASLSPDYCSYRKDADNSTITAARILDAFLKHMGGEK
jgi:heptosyltransferase-2